MKVERQLRGHVGVRRLLAGQHDPQPDRLGAGLAGAAVAGLHDAGAAAGADHEFPPAAAHGFLTRQPGETARFLVVVRQLGQRLCPRCVALVRRRDARAAEHHHCRGDLALRQDHLEFQELELQAHGPQLVPLQELRIPEGQPEGRRKGLRRLRDLLGPPGVVIRRREDRYALLGHGGAFSFSVGFCLAPLT